MTTTSSFSLDTVKPEFTASTFAYGDQMLPDVLHLAHGRGYVVAYNNHDSTDGYILLDFYNVNSNLAQTSVRIPHTTVSNTSATGAPSLTQLANGNVVVVWNNVDPTNPGIKWAAFTPSGHKISNEMTLIGGQNSNPHVEALSDGGFMLSYLRQNHVYVTKFDASGHSSSWATHLDDVVGATVYDPTSTVLSNGNVVVSWSSSSAGGTIELHARVCTPEGVPIGSELLLDGLGHNADPSIAAARNGGWAIAYADTSWPNENGSSGVSLNIISPHGSSASQGAIHVNTPGQQVDGDPAVTVLDNGFILVTWHREVSASSYDVRGRIFTSSGEPVSIGGSTDDFIISSWAGNDTFPDVAALYAGKFVTAWTSAQGGAQDIAATVKELVRTTTGNNADDTFTGDALRDVISSGGGNDTIDGGAGDGT
jgi:hypothetical protein